MNSRSIPRSLFRRTRRGVILLLVLGMMMMFALLTLTFMVVTSQSQRVAESGARKDTIVDYKDKTVGEQDTWNGLLELLRGSPYSSIGHHGLIESVYGHPVANGVDQLEFKIVRCQDLENTGAANELYDVSQYGPFYIGKGDGTNAHHLSNNGRFFYAPRGSFDPNTANATNTDLTNQLIGFCLYPTQNVNLRTVTIEEIADQMGNVLTFTKPREPRSDNERTDIGYTAYRNAFAQIQNTSARIVSKRVIRGHNLGQTTGTDGRVDDCILVVVRPFTPVTMTYGNNICIPYVNAAITDYTDFESSVDNTEFFTRCIVNGAPFSGTGIGYGHPSGGTPFSWEPALGLWDADTVTPLPLALRPNGRAPNTVAPFGVYKDYLDTNFVKMNVDYTAPDTNNMFLAWFDRRWSKDEYDANSVEDWRLKAIIPSFMRPSLIPYLLESAPWKQGWGTDRKPRLTMSQRMDMLRKVVLRPLPFDHPNFTGSNPLWDFSSLKTRNDWTLSTTAAQGVNPELDQWVDLNNPSASSLGRLAYLCGGLQWVDDNNYPPTNKRLVPALSFFDVDNDGDGIKEGIWIDAGLPVRMSSSGQMYKPLVSFTVIDMDGRVNVNAHGNHAQNVWSENYEFGVGSSFYRNPENETTGVRRRLADPQRVTSGSSQVVPRGNGYGPAGVRLAYALDAIRGVFRNFNYNPYKTPSIVDANATDGEIAAWRLMNGISTKVTSVEVGTVFVSPTLDTVSPYFWLTGRYGINSPDGLAAKPGNDDVSVGENWMTALYENRLPLDGADTGIAYNTGGAAPDLWDVAAVAFDVYGQRILSPVPFALGNPALWGAVRNLNPYRFDPYNDMEIVSNQASDQRFTPAELENLLRQTDVDQAYLQKRLERLLLTDPTNLDSDATLVRRGRDFLTTDSNDIPLPNPRYGVHSGIYTLIYKCVEDQVIRTGFKTGQLDLTYYDSRYDAVDKLPALRKDVANIVSPLVDKLVSMLPEQIRNGEKLDINQLTQKATWIDSTNLYGLQERADLARGIYILLMAMSYQQLYGIDDVFLDVNTASLNNEVVLNLSSEAWKNNTFPKVSGHPGYRTWAYAEPYFEQAFAQEDRLNWPAKSGNDQKKAQELARQVMATRLAQYAINLVDYADADATMTPMIFDIDPFAINVVSSSTGDAVMKAQNQNLRVNMTLSCWFDLSTSYVRAMDKPASYSDSKVGYASLIMPYYSNTGGWSNTQLRRFLATPIADADARFPLIPGVTQSMCRVRMLFGMERSDLLLTETLATHDLGIADTKTDDWIDPNDKKNKPRLVSEGDPDFDQVKMPEASAWFELYCTANPNQVVQPQDLYDYKVDSMGRKVWFLKLGETAPYTGLVLPNMGTGRLYPVWHLAVSKSTNPLDAAGSNGKPSNNIARRLADHKNDNIGNPITFSLQTQQPALKSNEFDSTTGTGAASYKRHFSSILGPTDVYTGAPDDVEIDRIVWFHKANSRIPLVYPNWEQIYWRRNNKSDFKTNSSNQIFDADQLLPSEYLVIAPRAVTFLGSRDKGQTALGGITRGFPSGECIDLRDEVPSINGGNTQNPLFTGAQMPKVIVAAAMPPHNWTNPVYTANLGVGTVYNHNPNVPDLNNGMNDVCEVGIGINISAPAPNRNSGGTAYDFDTVYDSFYPEPKFPNKAEDNAAFNDNRYSGNNKYYRIADNAGAIQNGFMWNLYKENPEVDPTYYPDKPFEDPTNPGGASHKASGPITEDQLFGTGTVPMVRSVMLQRLANPKFPYDPILNPYITVDWSMIDLTVFTGEEDVNATIPNDQISSALSSKGGDQKDQDSAQGVEVLASPEKMGPNKWDLRVRLSSRQWGRTGLPVDLRNTSHPNPWTRVIDPGWIFQDPDPVRDSRVLDPSLLIGSDATKDKAGTYEINNSPLLNSFMFGESDSANYHKKFDAAEIKKLNFPHRPQHSLGRLNWMYYSDNSTVNNTAPFVNGEFLHETRFTNQASGVRAFAADGTAKPHPDTGLSQYVLGALSTVNENPPPLSRAIPPNVFRGGRSADGDHLGRIVLTNSGETGGDYFGNVLLGAPIVVNAFVDHSSDGSSYSNFSNWDYRPFINLAWNNAPYPNPYEVMSVPASAPGRFGLEFVDREREDLRLFGAPVGMPNPYGLVLTNRLYHVDVNTTIQPPVYTTKDSWTKVGSLGGGGRFGYPLVDPEDSSAPSTSYTLPGLGHLMNFYHSSLNVSHNNRAVPQNLSMNLGAFLDHIQVPSRFQGTKEWVSPTGVYEPYSIPTYREPGKININTLTEPAWRALSGDRILPQAHTNQSNPLIRTMGAISNVQQNTLYDALSMSRRIGTPNYIGLKRNGIDGTDYIVDNTVGRIDSANSFNNSEPYRRLDFAYPFRSLASSNFVTGTTVPVAFQSPVAQMEGYGVPDPADATILRRYYLGVDANSNEQPFRPLLAPVVGGEFGQNWTGNGPHIAPARTVTEEFEGLQRLSNMTTTRSNVFAVWVTVGYFEAEQVDFTNEATTENPIAKLRQIYPDGYKYGKELGYGSGTEEMYRHRSFYLIDRTIPVGFRRGEDFNIDKTVILKKAIE